MKDRHRDSRGGRGQEEEQTEPGTHLKTQTQGEDPGWDPLEKGTSRLARKGQETRAKSMALRELYEPGHRKPPQCQEAAARNEVKEATERVNQKEGEPAKRAPVREKQGSTEDVQKHEAQEERGRRCQQRKGDQHKRDHAKGQGEDGIQIYSPSGTPT